MGYKDWIERVGRYDTGADRDVCPYVNVSPVCHLERKRRILRFAQDDIVESSMFSTHYSSIIYFVVIY